MRFLSFLLLFASTILASRAFAVYGVERPTFYRDHVVKVVSKMNDGSTTFKGSGLIAQKKGVVYVVTSDHVVLQSNDLATHEVYVRGNDIPNPCKILMTRYGSGLSLLKCEMRSPYVAYEFWSSHQGILQGSSDNDTIYLDPSPEEDPYYFKDDPDHYSLTMVGYPLESSDLKVVENVSSNLVMMEKYPLLVNVPVMAKMEGDAERGMSGGIAVYEGESRVHVRGILAYRYDKSGMPWIYVIPAGEASDMLRIATDYPQDSYPEKIFQTPRHQRRSHFDVQIGKYDFETFEEGRGTDHSRYLLRVRRVGRMTEVPEYLPRGNDFEKILDYHFARRKDCAVYLVGTFDYNKGVQPIQNIPKLYQRMLEKFESTSYSMICPKTKAVLLSLPALARDFDRLLEKAKAAGVDSKLMPVLRMFREDLRFFEKNPQAAQAKYPTWSLQSDRGMLEGAERMYGTLRFSPAGLEKDVHSLIERAEAAMAELVLYAR